MSSRPGPHRRLSGPEIGLLRHLARIPGFATLSRATRLRVLPLWRRRIVLCLYLQEPDSARALRGPFFQLSPEGHQLARKFLQADVARRAKGSPLFSSPARATARA